MKKIFFLSFALILFNIVNSKAQKNEINWEGTFTVNYQENFKIKLFKEKDKYKALVTTVFTDQLCTSEFPDQNTITLFFEKNTRGKGLSFIKKGDWIIQIKNIKGDFYFLHRGFPLTTNPDDIKMKRIKS
ncbi:hypothetical protein [Pedobacter aquatilis]|uniref:hypothetical protein n=1 Tax=Pedobacter aquatilis TaxID=351343 RepID=UPI002931593A|nr:hypothetical protein [Pedobacter aquatilis]